MARILVIEDDSTLRNVICRMLTKAGYEVLEASNGVDGTKIIEDQTLDLIVTDIVMPDQEGIETIVKVRRNHPGLKVIAMSGCSESSLYLQNAKQFGAEIVIKKPFERAEFLDIVKSTLESAAASA